MASPKGQLPLEFEAPKKPRLSRILEGAVKLRIRKWLANKNAWAFAPVSNGMGVHGIPDIIAALPVTVTQEMVGMTLGVFVGIEAKAPDKRKNTTARQRMQLLAIEATGAISAVVSCAEDIKELEGNLNDCIAGTKSSCLPFTGAFENPQRDTDEPLRGRQRRNPRSRAASAGRDEGTA